jgi:transposase
MTDVPIKFDFFFNLTHYYIFTMPAVSNFNKVRIVTLAHSGMPGRQIAAHLGISKTGVQAILRNWTQFGTLDRRPGSGRPRISSGEQDEAVINVVRDSPFTNAVEAVGVTNFPGSVRTARRRIKTSDLRNHVAARKTKLTPRHREARVFFTLFVIYRS